MGARRQFTPEFQRKAVQVLVSGSRLASEIAREYAECGSGLSSLSLTDLTWSSASSLFANLHMRFDITAWVSVDFPPSQPWL
jgi:hypothetical protein